MPARNTRTSISLILISAALVIGALYFLFLVSLISRQFLVDAAYKDPSLPIEERIDDLVSRMTLREKIGQMALVEKNSLPLDDVARYGIGGVLSGAGGKPKENTPEGWRVMIGGYVAASRASRTGIPILYGLDANHGHGNVPDTTIFPHQVGLGAANDTVLAENVARITAKEVRATGAHWIYSPSLDLPTDIRWGRVYEAFSDDPVRAAELGAAVVRGLKSANTVATAKHFVGAGSMTWGSSINQNFSIDQGATYADEYLLRTQYLPPFKRAIEAGVESIMVGLNMWGEHQMSSNRYLITDILKKELGFQGFVVSDWYGAYEISESKYASAVQAINAGIDMVMLPYEYKRFINDVERAIRRGDITKERIDSAVRRILRVKFSSGLFDDAFAMPDLSVIGSPEHRALAREAAARSIVILKNSNVLPILNARKIRVAGSGAHNIGMQTGAWTVEWQGIDGNWLSGATSILAGIQNISKAEVQYALDGRFTEEDIADIGIAIVGEKPYAEGWGDAPLPRLSAADLAAIARLDEAVEKLVIVIISGRPLIITDELSTWDALVAAWLPGSEGVGVADVLFGKKTTSATLPLPWPRTIGQIPFSLEGSSDGTPPLFPRNFRLILDRSH